MNTPSLDVVHRVVEVLTRCSIPVALGGSGLLAALGLTTQVRDWDLTTDAEPAQVREALASSGLVFVESIAADGVFATRARFLIQAGDHDVDLMVGFAAHVGSAVVQFSTRVTRWWQDLPVGDPVVWAEAYRLIGRSESAAALAAWRRSPPPADGQK